MAALTTAEVAIYAPERAAVEEEGSWRTSSPSHLSREPRGVSLELAAEGIAVYTVDPGLTATSPGMEDFGARPVEDGAASVLAPLHTRVEHGSFMRDGKPLAW